MSTTTTTLMTTTLVGSSSAMTKAPTSGTQCPACGGSGECHDPSEVQQRILELEAHVRELNERAALTAGKLAEYEEVHRLRSAHAAYASSRSSSSQPPSSSHADRALSPTQVPIPISPETPSQISPQTQQSRLATLTSLLPYRRGSSTPSSAPLPATPTAPINPLRQVTSPANSDNTSELQHALTREQGLRRAAETQLTQASTELEDLTVQLFSQANEMVAQERKARAKLEERVAVLERRDVEKRSRLDRLEKAIARVDRLRALVNK